MRCGNRRGLFGWTGWRGRHRRNRLPAERVAHALGHVESRLSLSDVQRAEWEAFATIVRDGAEALGVAGTGAPDGLARIEAKAEAGLAILKRVRPAFDGLYAVLDPTQRNRLDEMMARTGLGRHAA